MAKKKLPEHPAITSWATRKARKGKKVGGSGARRGVPGTTGAKAQPDRVRSVVSGGLPGPGKRK